MSTIALVALRIVATPVLSALLVASFVAVTVGHVAKGSVLDPGFYSSALAENAVYDRLYSEVLGDVAFAEDTDNLSGGVQPADSAELEALLREVLPPEYVQGQVEVNIQRLLAYLKGERSDPSLALDMEPVLERVGPAAIGFVSIRLGAAEPREAESFDAFMAELDQIVSGLARGEIPGSVPSFGLSGAELDEATSGIIGLYEGGERQAVETALARGDTVAAIQAALGIVMQPGIDERIAALRAELGPEARLDLVAQAAEDAGETREEWVADLAPARRIVSNVDTWVVPGATVGLLGCALLLGLIYAPGRRRMLLVSGSALMTVGILGFVAWYVHSQLVPPAVYEWAMRLEGAKMAPWRPILGDVAESMARESSARTWQPGLVAMVAGVGLAMLGLLTGRRRAGGLNQVAPHPIDFTAAGPAKEEREVEAA